MTGGNVRKYAGVEQASHLEENVERLIHATSLCGHNVGGWTNKSSSKHALFVSSAVRTIYFLNSQQHN
jgi:hypothetical protein